MKVISKQSSLRKIVIIIDLQKTDALKNVLINKRIFNQNCDAIENAS